MYVPVIPCNILLFSYYFTECYNYVEWHATCIGDIAMDNNP